MIRHKFPYFQLMKTLTAIWIMLTTFALCGELHAQRNRVIETFRSYITGDFDNSEQVTAEIKAGRQVHPLSIHVNRIADAKVRNRPPGMKGFFILEESYYLSEGKPLERKPYLFLFEPEGADKVRLTAFQLPGDIRKEDLRNDNDMLFFDYATLQRSPTFKGAVYDWNASEKSFSTVAPNELPGGMKFTLIERFTRDALSVMELLEKDGKRLTPYDTPILYRRK
jgi:hypothetical protein